MPDPEYYYYYESTVWGDQKCVELSHNHSPTNLFDSTPANNGRHVSFLSENDYSNISGTYSKVGLYNIYQIEREINILTKNLYQIMMEINTCTVNGDYYDGNTGGYNGSGGINHTNCGNYNNLSKLSSYWDLKEAYSRLVPTDRISKKTLCQQYHDLKNLVSNFNSILARIQTKGITPPPTPIPSQVVNNSLLRDEIEKKLDNIYANPDSRELDSVRMLDSTVYTSVLWTVLATSVIFFMFKKM